MKVEHTERGFEIIQFTDLYGQKCSLQQSSLAEQSCICMGCDNNYTNPLTGQPGSPRMHLNQEMVVELFQFLSNWLLTDSFELNDSTKERSTSQRVDDTTKES